MNIRDANLERPIRARRTAARVKPINLALQGGGAHGAFAWGVLDRLLEDGRLTFEGVSATSAGAMNAAVLAHGLLHGGPDRARLGAGLDTVFRQVNNRLSETLAADRFITAFVGVLDPSANELSFHSGG